MKIAQYLLIIFLGLFLFSHTGYTEAAETACVKTKVGNPQTEPTMPPECLTSPSETTNSGENTGSGTGSETGTTPPNYPADLRQAIIDKFGIYMNNFSQQHLKWAWEKYWDVSGSRFNELVKGSIVTSQGAGGYSSQVGCPGSESVRLGEYATESFFKFILIHELGHVVRNCNSRERIQYTAHLNALAAEGAVSYYGANASYCTGSDNPSEDYADMIAYYLTPSAGLATARCDPDQNRPNPFFKLVPRKEAHYQVVIKVL